MKNVFHVTLGEESGYMDTNEINSRSYFPESWLWIDIKLPAGNADNPNRYSNRDTLKRFVIVTFKTNTENT